RLRLGCGRPVRHVLDTSPRSASGTPSRWPVPISDAVWHVPLAYSRPDSIQTQSAGKPAGARLARRRPLSAPAVRYRIRGLLVSNPAESGVPRLAGQGLPGDHLGVMR